MGWEAHIFSRCSKPSASAGMPMSERRATSAPVTLAVGSRPTTGQRFSDREIGP